jgi:hypothetical protein
MPSIPGGRKRYRIAFRGESDVLTAAFPDLTPSFEGGNTVLTGEILDRAQLQGILVRADSLGFELVSVNPVEPTMPGDDLKEKS